MRTFVWRGGEKEKVTLWASVGTASLREDAGGSELVGRFGEMVRQLTERVGVRKMGLSQDGLGNERRSEMVMVNQMEKGIWWNE